MATKLKTGDSIPQPSAGEPPRIRFMATKLKTEDSTASIRRPQGQRAQLPEPTGDDRRHPEVSAIKRDI